MIRSIPLVSTVLAIGCATQPAVDTTYSAAVSTLQTPALAQDVAAPPLNLEIGDLEPGNWAIATVSGLAPDARVYLGVGDGPAISNQCLPNHPSVCADINVREEIGFAFADQSGVANIAFEVPPAAPPGNRVIFQAVGAWANQAFVSAPLIKEILDDVCAYPEWTVGDATPSGAPIDAVYWGYGLIGAINGSSIEDFDGTTGPWASQLRITIFDTNILPVCSFAFDAESAVAVNPAVWGPSDTGTMPDAGFQIDTTNAPMWTDCGPVNPTIFGTANLGDWFRGSFGIGFSPMIELGPALQPAVDAAGLDWANDWEPNVFSAWISINGGPPFEGGYSFAFEEVCGVMTDDGFGNGVMIPSQPGVLEGIVDSQPYYVFAL